jgi:hypothetical protein
MKVLYQLFGLCRMDCNVGRIPACVKTCNSQDTISATWRKERSIVETNEIMKTAAYRSESWCWHQLLSLLSHVLMLVLKQLVCGRPKVVSLLLMWVDKVRIQSCPDLKYQHGICLDRLRNSKNRGTLKIIKLSYSPMSLVFSHKWSL